MIPVEADAAHLFIPAANRDRQRAAESLFAGVDRGGDSRTAGAEHHAVFESRLSALGGNGLLSGFDVGSGLGAPLGKLARIVSICCCICTIAAS